MTTKTVTTVPELMRTLDQLAPDLIAATIQAADVKGRVATAFGCPLAVFLTKRTGIRCGVSSADTLFEPTFDTYEYYVHGSNLKQFVLNFDDGKYPFLDASKT